MISLEIIGVINMIKIQNFVCHPKFKAIKYAIRRNNLYGGTEVYLAKCKTGYGGRHDSFCSTLRHCIDVNLTNLGKGGLIRISNPNIYHKDDSLRGVRQSNYWNLAGFEEYTDNIDLFSISDYRNQDIFR